MTRILFRKLSTNHSQFKANFTEPFHLLNHEDYPQYNIQSITRHCIWNRADNLSLGDNFPNCIRYIDYCWIEEDKLWKSWSIFGRVENNKWFLFKAGCDALSGFEYEGQMVLYVSIDRDQIIHYAMNDTDRSYIIG